MQDSIMKTDVNGTLSVEPEKTANTFYVLYYY